MGSHFENICEIRKSDQLGRFLSAKRHIKPGEMILSEEPIIVGPYWDADISCLNCLRSATRTCKRCLKAPLCRDCSGHDAAECNFYEQATNLSKNFLFDHFNTVTPIRCLLLYRRDKAKFQQMMEMESHCEKRKGTEIWNIHQQYVVEPLMCEAAFHALDDLEINADLLQQICGILDVNTFEIRGNMDSQGVQMNNLARGLYPCTSLMTHNCQTNTLIAVDGMSKLRLYASVSINAGDLLYYNYTRVLFSTFERQTHLEKGKYFICTCSRCKDPTEFGTHLSSIKCTECNTGLCLFYDQVPKWECNVCGYQMAREYVNRVMCEAREDVSSCALDIRILEKVIGKHSKTLNPHHSLVLEAKQSLAGELRSLCMSYDTQNVPRQALKRRLELCEEMLTILRVLDPGISRLTGIALYEYQAALVELSRRNHDTGEITTLDLQTSLKTAESALKEAISMLLFEHPTTPEGHLTKKAMCELKTLREDVQNVQAMIEDEQTLQKYCFKGTSIVKKYKK
ncbi:SET domain-containing protein SmydA-8-like [Anopheles ziemanni]|uniref:SET domain-containing protein SmydA-8-like n=1 Tax=Anopheles coustani TaxID=139045 RepID=UPI00265B07C6|nr:SET domain-containing protein SmydA-8-like [Anopheles coustani]XP_058176936.1 SET domain-containing protein SmydA-8-like [Anopheles ziemanni]